MTRLTKKKENDFYELKSNNKIYDEENDIRLVQIIGQLEDLEEELGIDFITLFKALRDGIWVKDDYGQITHVYVTLYNLSITQKDKLNYCFITFDNTFILFASYGKVWTLTKEELQYE